MKEGIPENARIPLAKAFDNNNPYQIRKPYIPLQTHGLTRISAACVRNETQFRNSSVDVLSKIRDFRFVVETRRRTIYSIASLHLSQNRLELNPRLHALLR